MGEQPNWKSSICLDHKRKYEMLKNFRQKPAGGGGATVLEGYNTTEATTTSTSAVDLLSITGLSITVSTPIKLFVSGRSTGGAAAAVGLGLKLNATVVGEAVAGGVGAIWLSRGDDAVQSGAAQIYIGPRVTNHLRSGAGTYNCFKTTSNEANHADIFNTADAPAATITAIIFRGISGNGSVTLGADEAFVYSLATS